MEKTRIDWCDSTWNPVTGCYHGCEYCYARGIANRFGSFETIDGTNIKALNTGSTLNCIEVKTRVGNPYPVKFTPTLHRYRLNEYEQKEGRNIFVCSMADLFGSWVPDSWIEEVFAACEKAPQHHYLFLTKNPGRYVELINNTDFFVRTQRNMWFGYSYTGKNSRQWWNPDYNIFASVEPIMEPVESPHCKWLIVGAETGNRKDKVIPEKSWIESLLEECRKYDIPMFMKASLAEIWGEQLIQEFPEGLRRTHGKDT